MMRDLTKRELEAALNRRGFTQSHFGYWQLPESSVLVFAANGGATRRQQLQYLIAEERKLNR